MNNMNKYLNYLVAYLLSLAALSNGRPKKRAWKKLDQKVRGRVLLWRFRFERIIFN